MIAFLALTSFLFLLIATYHTARFLVRRTLESLFIAATQIAWPFLIARELELTWVSLPSVIVLLGIAMILSGLWVAAILYREAGRPRPFRDWK